MIQEKKLHYMVISRPYTNIFNDYLYVFSLLSDCLIQVKVIKVTCYILGKGDRNHSINNRGDGFIEVRFACD